MVCPICGGRLISENPLGMTSHIVCDTCSFIMTTDGNVLIDEMDQEDVDALPASYMQTHLREVK